MKRKFGSNKKKGQTALEYALVIGVVVLGVIVAAKSVFFNPEGGAKKLMDTAVQQTFDEMTNSGQ